MIESILVNVGITICAISILGGGMWVFGYDIIHIRRARRMMGRVMTMKTIDISGFGGSYEAACQKMLLNGLRWLNKHPDFDFKHYKAYKNVTGLCIGEGSDTKSLDDAICEGVDPSGAMHHAVISHLAYIHQNSYDSWLAQAKKQGREIIEQPSEDELDKILLISQVEWQLKLDRGYNPLAELFKTVPKDNIIEFDPKNEESIKEAAEKIAKILKGKS